MERFWNKVRRAGPDECWLWTASTNKGEGYGQFGYEGKVVKAHRFSWHLAHPEDRRWKTRCVLHRCDVRRCVNPAHLFLGTSVVNTEDARLKGRLHGGGLKRARKGSILSWAIVRNIRANYKGTRGELKDLCEKHGVSKWTMIAMLNGRTWKETGGVR